MDQGRGRGRGEAILDFVMSERAVLGLKPSTTTGGISAVRYLHVIHGRPDSATSGARYKLLLKFLTRKLPSCQMLSYRIDLLTWVYGNISETAPNSHRIKKIWGGLDLSLCFC